MDNFYLPNSEIQSALRMWSPVGGTCSSGGSHTQEYMVNKKNQMFKIVLRENKEDTKLMGLKKGMNVGAVEGLGLNMINIQYIKFQKNKNLSALISNHFYYE